MANLSLSVKSNARSGRKGILCHSIYMEVERSMVDRNTLLRFHTITSETLNPSHNQQATTTVEQTLIDDDGTR